MMPVKQSKSVVVIWLVIALIALIQLLFNSRYHSDMTAFMPQQTVGPLNQALKEGPAARLWLLALSGASADELAQSSQRLAQQLRDSGDFDQVFNGASELDADSDDLLGRYRYLLDDRVDADYFSSASLAAFLNQRLDELRSPLSGFSKRWLASDPTAAQLQLLQKQAGSQNNLVLHQGVWLTQDHTQALLMAESRAPGFDLDAQQAVKEKLLQQLAAPSQAGPVTLLLSGAPEIALQTRNTIQSDAQRLSLYATLFMLLFLAWVYRSWQRVLLSALPLLGGILLAAAAVAFWFGNLHLITLAFGITVLGVAVDYPIHLFSHIRNGEGANVAMTRIWPTLRLGVISTLLGYVAMALTDFTGLAQLGLFSIVGLLAAALITRTLLPLLDVGGVERDLGLSSAERFMSGAAPAWLKMVALLGLLAAVVSVMQQQTIWSDDIARLSPISDELRKQDRNLREQLGGAANRYLISVEANSLEELLQTEERLAAVLDAAVVNHELDHYSMAAQLLPSRKSQLARQAVLPDEATLRHELTQALAGLPFQARTFEPFVQAVLQSQRLEPLQYSSFAAPSLQSQLESLLSFSDQQVGGMVRLSNLAQPHELQQRLQQAALPGITFVDVKQSSNAIVRQFREAAVERIALAAGLILVALWFGLGERRRLLQVVAPVLGAVLVAAVIPLLAGAQLNLFNLVSLLLVAGIGLDYSLFFSRTREEGDTAATLHALLVCCISTVTVFAILSTSAIPVLHAIGITVFSGALAAFALAWIFSRTRITSSV